MKYSNILKASFAALLGLFAAVGCSEKEFEEVTEISLSRCLEPQNLSARVDVATGDNVTFGWNVNKDADSYNLVIYTDEEMTTEYSSEIVDPAEVPYTIRLTADQKYWFKVQATSESREASVWAVYDGNVKTYAVKDNLFLEVKGRTATSVSLAWSKDLSDYKEVTRIEAAPVKGGSKVTKTLSDAEATAAAATIDGLAASTEYQITLFYMSASRGAVDTWTMAEQGAATRISTAEELKTAVVAGGDFFLAYGADAYAMGTAKPAASLTLVGELGPDGQMPVITGNVELTSALAEGSSLRFENVCISDSGATGHVVTFTDDAAPAKLDKIEFVNCELTGFKSGLFYNNKSGGLTVGEVLYDSCLIHGILGSGGDGFDIRKPTAITTVKFVNNTIYDGFRTFVRLDANDAIQIGGFVFENNTIKGISVMNDSNNQGFFAPKIATTLTLKSNLFLWEDGGETGEGVDDKCQLVRDNSAIVLPTITAENNYAYAQGKDFFKAVSAANAGFVVMNADPCYNSKGNFFQLSAQDLIEQKVGASKWWISYVEKTEDLTQNFVGFSHTWNLQDATLFAGDIKNARVRDELMLVGSEATPLKADAGIEFLGASELTKKGVPTAGYVSFKVDRAGSVDYQVEGSGNGSLVIATLDENGFAVQGGAVASAFKPGVQKILLPDLKGEGTVYLYATGAIKLTKLAWSPDVIGGNKVLPTPKPAVEPVTLTEGDETDVTVTWDYITNAASYVVVFNKKAYPAQEENSFTVAGADIAALKAGLYTFTVQALPRAEDIYYTKSDQGAASVAIQPKSAGGEIVEHDIVWDFSAADWQEALGELGAVNTDITNIDLTVEGLTFHSGSKSKYNTTYIQFGGKSGEMDRYFQFTAPEQGTLKITSSNTGSAEAMDRTVAVTVGDDTQAQAGGFGKATPGELEFSVAAGEVVITAPVNGLCFYKIEYIYTTTSGGAAAVEYDWNFSDADWVEAFQTNFTAINSNQDVTFALNGLTVGGGGTIKYNFVGENVYFIQTGGKGTASTRCFQFDAPDAGTIKVWASNTGDSEALDRTVAVAVDGVEVDAQPGGYAKSAGPHELEFAITAGGHVSIYPPVNGLCFYHVYYTNK